MRATFSRLLSLLALGLATTPARALIVFNYVAAANERFDPGLGTFPTSPVANTSGSFVGAGFDFSGVGWQTASSDFSVTMISPQLFVTARHAAPADGASLTFFNQGGVLKTYTVSSTSAIFYNGQQSDLAVGVLSAPIATVDHVASYPILYFGTPFTSIDLPSYSNPTLLVYGKRGRIGTNTIVTFANGDLYPLGAPDGVIDSLWFYTVYNSVTGQSQSEAGDSGSPTFALVNGTLSLVGTRSAIATLNGKQISLDNFLALPGTLSQIGSIASNYGQSVTVQVVAVPEPAVVAIVLGGLALAGALRRRRRR